MRSMECVITCLQQQPQPQQRSSSRTPSPFAPASAEPPAAASAAAFATSASASSTTAAPSLGKNEVRLLEREVLDGAHIVFCTLNGAGEAFRLAEVRGGFETVIFDEAAQAGELSTLIPLQYGARRVILVGDPQQLPATVLSMDAKRRGYDVSLFERLHRGGHIPRMLRTQLSLIHI